MGELETHARLARCCTCRINKCDAQSPTPLAGWLAFNQLSESERAAHIFVSFSSSFHCENRRAVDAATACYQSAPQCMRRVPAYMLCAACRAESTAGRVSCARHDCVSNRFLCASCLSVSAAPEKRQRVPSAYNRFIK
jgi:hypothetical protein